MYFKMGQQQQEHNDDASAVAQGLHCATLVQFCATGNNLVQLRAVVNLPVQLYLGKTGS